MSPLEDIDPQALRVYREGLAERGASVAEICRRLGIPFDLLGDQVSKACRRLVELGHAERSPFGYRKRRLAQPELTGCSR